MVVGGLGWVRGGEAASNVQLLGLKVDDDDDDDC